LSESIAKQLQVAGIPDVREDAIIWGIMYARGKCMDVARRTYFLLRRPIEHLTTRTVRKECLDVVLTVMNQKGDAINGI
jgi:hypothetical protein